MKRNGFTLVELIVVITLISILASFITLNLSSVRNRSSASSVLDQLVSDIRQQQMRVMNGRSGVNSSGVYFALDSYVLFDGATYNPVDPANFAVELPADITLTSITLPGSQIVFTKPSGEVNGYVAGSDSFKATSSGGAAEKTITFNLFGVPDVD